MNKGTIRRSALCAGVAPMALGMMLTTPLAAQTVSPPSVQDSANPANNEAKTKAEASGITPPAAQDDSRPDNDTIIVTGTRIANPNNESPVPITALSGQEFYKTGQVSVGDRINQLPSVRATFSSQNSTDSLGTAGLSLIDLRGLGTQRTLVLVNGRRFVAGDILNNAVSTDINNIPTDLLERVDITTGGGSAIYGSDAISGVVNFVLKDHYEGIEARAQGGMSQYGDAGAYRASILAGKNFAEGRGNIAANVEYTHQTDFYGSDRPNDQQNHGFVQVESDPVGSINGSDGIPDRIFLTDIRRATIANGGLVSFASPTGACGKDFAGHAFNCTYLFQPNGTLIPQTGQRLGLAPNGSFQGGNGDTLREGNQLVLQPRQDRITANVLGHYEISDALVPFIEATYTHEHVTGSTSGPAFFQGSTIDANLERPRLDNPFLTDQARALITSQLIASGVNPATITGATRFKLQENLLDLGVRNEEFKRDTFRIVGGLRGDLGSDWHYEVYGNYGQFKETNVIQGNLNTQRFLLALDSGRNAAGQIVCRSQINPAFGDPAQNGTVNGDIDNRLPNDIAACVPLNPFGRGNISQAARDYVLQDTEAHGKITQTVASASITGDSSKWFELPGGPVGVAFGGEYRRETARYTNDQLVRDGYTFYNAIPDLIAPSFEVKEAFAEIQFPILKDVPFFQELTLKGAGRYAHYKGSTGTVYAYNGSLDWKPIEDFRFRASYARAVRAPNLTELYSAQTQNFAPAFIDPCSARNIAGGTTFRAANCAAAGIPASYDFQYIQSLEIRSGGNPNLQAEKSDSYTFGGVITPRFLPGLVFSVDYFHIQVNNVIASVDAQTIANQCYDEPTLNNPFCSLFQRAGAGGGPNGEIPNQILEGSLLSSVLNFAKLRSKGIDFDMAYHRRLAFGEIGSHLYYTHTIQRNNYTDPTNPNFADFLTGELGYPKDEFTLLTDFRRGKFTFSYELRYVGKAYISSAENIVSSNGNPPQNADYADRTYYPAVFYHNARFGLDVTDRFNVYLGVDNFTNRAPPFGLTGVTDGGGKYDVRGRYFYSGIIVKF